MDVFTLMEKSPEFAEFITSGRPVAIVATDDEDEKEEAEVITLSSDEENEPPPNKSSSTVTAAASAGQNDEITIAELEQMCEIEEIDPSNLSPELLAEMAAAVAAEGGPESLASTLPPPVTKKVEPSANTEASLASRIIPSRRSANLATNHIKQSYATDRHINQLINATARPKKSLAAGPSRQATSILATTAKISTSSSKLTLDQVRRQAQYIARGSRKLQQQSGSSSATANSAYINRILERQRQLAREASESPEAVELRRARAREAKQKCRARETTEQRTKRLARNRVYRLKQLGRFEEAARVAKSIGLAMRTDQQQIKEEESESLVPIAASTSNQKKSVSPVNSSNPAKKWPKREEYFGVDPEWDRLVVAQEVTMTTITRSGRQCKAKKLD